MNDNNDVAEAGRDLIAGARQHQKALRVPHDKWQQVGKAAENEQVRHFCHVSTGEMAYAGSDNFLHRWRDERSKLRALGWSIAQQRWPDGVQVFHSPGYGVCVLTDDRTARSVVVLMWTTAAIRVGLAELLEHRHHD